MLRGSNVLMPVPEELGPLVPVEIGPTVRVVELVLIVDDPLEELEEGEEKG